MVALLTFAGIVAFLAFSSWGGYTGRFERWNQWLEKWAESMNPDKDNR